MLGNGIFFFVDLEIEKKVKLVLVVYVIKIFIENYCVFGIYRFNKFLFWFFFVRIFVFL